MVTERDRTVLDFPKDRAIGDYLDLSATRYYQAIRRLIDDDGALAYAPLTIRRLRRMRRVRLEQIATRVSGDGAT